MTIARAIFLVEIAILAVNSVPVMAANAPATTTTIYVGKHFEIRDYDAAVKYVFSGDTRVARITRPLTSTSLIQRFRIHSGWNLLSLGLSVTNVLSQITNIFPAGGTSTMAVRWDDASSAWLPLSLGESLTAGAILWLHAANDASLTLAGTYEEPTNRTLNANGSFLASAGLDPWDLTSALSNAPSSTAWVYDNSTGEWLVWLPPPFPAQTNSPPLVASGSAVFIRAAQPAEFDVPGASSTIRYYHEDHLSSSSVLTDSSGVLVEELSYFPFGSSRNRFEPGLVSEGYGFTQKERDRESGLHYFEARFLATPVSRFLTPDSKYSAPEALPDNEFSSLLAKPQALNLYAYVVNNPVVHTDPTGLDAPKPPKPDPAAQEEANSSGVTLTIVFDSDPKHPKSIEIPVGSVQLLPSKAKPQGEKDSDKPQPGEIVINKEMDKFSPLLFQESLQGKGFEATITFKKPGKSAYLSITVKDAFITSVNKSGSGDGGIPKESISINGFISTEFHRPAPDPGPETVTYDLEPGKQNP